MPPNIGDDGLLFFGVLLPILLGLACTYLCARSLKMWCGTFFGTVVAVVLGLEVGIVLPSLFHGIMSSYMLDAFDKDFWTRAASASIWTALFGSVWGAAFARPPQK
jgi:hypothetical protein